MFSIEESVILEGLCEEISTIFSQHPEKEHIITSAGFLASKLETTPACVQYLMGLPSFPYASYLFYSSVGKGICVARSKGIKAAYQMVKSSLRVESDLHRNLKVRLETNYGRQYPKYNRRLVFLYTEIPWAWLDTRLKLTLPYI